MHWIEHNRPAPNIFVRLVERLFRRKIQRQPNKFSELQGYEAADALILISNVPNATTDKLAALIRGRNDTVANCAAHALRGLAEHSPAAAAALVATESPGLQIYGMEHLHNFARPQVTTAVPALRQCLTNANVPVRIHATLLRIAPETLNK